MPHDSGFSIVEVVIASMMLLFIALGVLPLFTRSMGLNVEGRLSTEISHHARSKLEQIESVDMRSPLIQVPVGATELLITEYLLYGEDDPATPSIVEDAWVDSADYTVGDPWLYRRTTRVQQFEIEDMDDDGLLSDDEALDGSELDGVDPDKATVKRIEVTVDSWGFGGSPRKQLTIQTLKIA